MIHPWLKRHMEFLAEVDCWFDSLRRRQAKQMQCGRGCAGCCHGLFDISLADALLLAEGLAQLEPEVLARAKADAEIISRRIGECEPDLKMPHFLDALSEARLDRIVEQANSPRCPLLGKENQCLVYAHRPLACRLEGAPMVDARDGLFGDWCELNFTAGVPEEALRGLERDYYELQEVEEIATEILSEALLQSGRRNLTVFIPSIVGDFEGYWKKLIDADRR